MNALIEVDIKTKDCFVIPIKEVPKIWIQLRKVPSKIINQKR